MTGLIVNDVCKTFYSRERSERMILDGVSLELQTPSFVTIVGPNACGKTTLLNIIAGIVRPDSGTVEVRSRDAGRPARIGYVWQDYRASLLPWLNVAENIAFPLRVQRIPRERRYAKATELLETFAPHIRPEQRCYELSGGQQQLVSLLRSVAADPDLLLLDEPFSSLDQPTRLSMAMAVERMWLVMKLQEIYPRFKIPILFVSHDVDEAVLLADRILLMTRNKGAFEETVVNESARPRTTEMLSADIHLRCRQRVLDFLARQGALQVPRSGATESGRPIGQGQIRSGK